MITPLNITLPEEVVQFIKNEQYNVDYNKKVELNSPTGDFFYDEWLIKPEYKDSLWETMLASLNMPVGQARVICLKGEECYTRHADIDDRYHLNLAGDEGYLIDFDTHTMHKTFKDFEWYEIDAGRYHSAASFGRHVRIQLVVRKLLVRNILTIPVNVSVELTSWDSRYMFDNTLSKWLNVANKAGYINNFSVKGSIAMFEVEESRINELKQIVPEEVTINISSI